MSIPHTPLAVYDKPHQFEPLLPSQRRIELGERARPVIEAALRLQGSAHGTTLAELRGLVRAMNSYYSNRIEGQSTHPAHIVQALKADFSASPGIATRQRLALAHIRTEAQLEAQVTQESAALHSRTLLLAHRLLYEQLPDLDGITPEGLPVHPGQPRRHDVTAHRHQPPTHASIPLFLARADERYARTWGLEDLLVAAACAHHRMTWVHPFADGNGRACRLQTHAALQSLTHGLWSVNRGFARQREAYYLHLSEADMARQGDLDGRGNLSERMLMAWCEFFIHTCLDQVRFMTHMLNLDELKERLAALVAIRAQQAGQTGYRPQAVLALHHVFALGPVARGEFVQLTGLADRTGRKVLAQLLADGLLLSDSPKGPVRMGFPIDALGLLFPNLYPEAAAMPADY